MVLGAAVIFAVGLVDDLRDVSAPAKMAGQVLAGSILYFFGRHHAVLPGPVRRHHVVLSPDLVPLITVLWVVGMANAVNLIDGLDGLAAGIVGHRRRGVLPLRPPAVPAPGSIRADNSGPLVAVICLRDLPRLPAPQLPPGPDLHGRRRGHAPRAC